MQHSQLTLWQRVAPSNIRTSLASAFGPDASKAALACMSAYQAFQQQGGTRGGGGQAAMLMACVTCLCQMMSSGGGAGGGGAGGMAGFTPPPAGQKPPSDQQLAEDKGVLISGCQVSTALLSHCSLYLQPFETSADACPSGNPQKAFGALTNAITTLVRKHPDITFHQLVGEVSCPKAVDNHSR